MSEIHHAAKDLPARIPIFPLAGCILLPRGRLPLNIFEPRYLEMCSDALSGQRIIGMVQPTEPESSGKRPPVYQTGCAGRITAFKETDDRRYLITLTGVCRYHVASEIETRKLYWIPHSVTIVCAATDGKLYVGARNPDGKRWVTNVDRDPEVRLKIGDRVYELRLVPVESADVREAVFSAYSAKYGWSTSAPEERPPFRSWEVVEREAG